MGARIIIITPPNVNAPSSLASQKAKDDWTQAQLEAAAAELDADVTPATYSYTFESA